MDNEIPEQNQQIVEPQLYQPLNTQATVPYDDVANHNPKSQRRRWGIIISVLAILAVCLGIFMIVNYSDGQSESVKTTQSSDASQTSDKNEDKPSPTALDQAQKLSLARLLSVAEEAAANNKGRYPADAAQFSAAVTGSTVPNLVDPLTSNAYEFTDILPTTGTVQYASGKKCQDTELISTTSRTVAFRIILGSGAIYCVNS